MDQGRPQVGVVPMDWPVFLRQRPARTCAGVAVRGGPSGRPAGHPVHAGARSGAGHPRAPGGRSSRPSASRLLLDFVSAQVARVLGAVTAASVDERQPLHELGLDSLMAVELRNLLGAGLGLDSALPATLVFDYPTVEALASYLTKTVVPPASPVRPPAPAELGGPVDLLTSIELMSDDDVAKLMAD